MFSTGFSATHSSVTVPSPVVIPRHRATPTTTTRVMNTRDIWQWLGPLAHGWRAEDRLKEQTVVLRWGGTGLGSLARALYVDRGVLHLAVASHVVAAELNLLKGKVLARLEEVAPGCGVTDLRFQVRAGETPRVKIAVPSPTTAARRRARRDLPAGLPRGLRDAVSEVLAWAQARDEAILAAGGWACPQCGLALVKEQGVCPPCGIEQTKVQS